MPIYQYISEFPDESSKSCLVCSKGFELRRPIDREALKVCLICKHPIRKQITSVNTPRLTKPFSVSEAKKAGFSVLEKRDMGVYEKL